MTYHRYGISEQLVEKVKKKLKNPVVKEKVKKLLDGVTKNDLQQPAKVQALIKKTAVALGIKIDPRQQENIKAFVLDQKIDPKNTFHLIKLWRMFH